MARKKSPSEGAPEARQKAPTPATETVPETEPGVKVQAAKAPAKAKPQAKPKAAKPKPQAVSPKAAKPAPPPLVVGVGASAGGLEAFTDLLRHLPRDTGMAFVLLQHLPPKQHSMLAQILSKATLLPVEEAREDVVPQPDHVYILPPGEIMELRQGALRLARREISEGRYLPVDTFLRSLAEERSSQAIGVILSGTASDGVQGMKAIKEAGGITFAQDVQTAKYPGMPQSSVAAGCVDFVLPPEGIALELTRIARHPYISPVGLEDVMKPEEQTVFGQILSILKRDTGVDFTFYKHSTIRRRTLRRMALNKVETFSAYLEYLKGHPDEVSGLYTDILINVTSFFRDPEVFEELKNTVYPILMKDRTQDAAIRIWVPGCSTGEEVYSLAISLLEFFVQIGKEVPLQIFGTDIDGPAIEVARSGRYGLQITENVSPERLGRYFIKVDAGYQIHKSIRDRCTFARQNIVKDPPFSHLDLVSCRNVLIYLGPVLQKKVIPIFHFALKPKGFLLLGRSEAIGAFQEMFTLVDKKNKIYVKKELAARVPLQFTMKEYPIPLEAPLVELPPEAPLSSLDLMKEADRIVLARFSPAGVVVDEDLKIIQFRGLTGPYLEPMPGEASLNLLRMVREGLRPEVGAAVHHAIKGGTPVRKEGLKVRYNGQVREVNVEVFPIGRPLSTGRFYLVVFEDVTRRSAPEKLEIKRRKGKPTSRDERLKELERELTATKDYLQATIEEQEATLEELKSTNEEIMSSNEELQSLNEELDASREELQSANEELATVNEELENRNTELAQINDDLVNLLTSVDIPILFLDQNLRIRRFNAGAEEVLHLVPTDTGRPIGDIKIGLEIEDLEAMLRESIDKLRIHTGEVQDRQGRWHLLQVRPYKTAENRIEGLVLTLTDIDDLKRSLERVQEAKNYTQAIVETVREPLVVLDGELKVVSANPSFYRTFGMSPEDTENRFLYEIGRGQWNIPKIIETLRKILPSDMPLVNFEVEHTFPSIGRRTMLLNARVMTLDPKGQNPILLAIEDITERKRAEDALKASEQDLRHLTGQLLSVQEQERQKIALELHDGLGQSLASLKMNLREVERGVPEEGSPEKGNCLRALDLINGVIEDIRRLTQGLSPTALQDLGLSGTLRQLEESFCKDLKLECSTEIEDSINQLFVLEDQVSLYRIFQEALANIGKHAEATRVTLVAKRQDRGAFFQIADNGKGFDPAQVMGVGLRSMAERARLLGGSLTIDSRPGAGTTLSFTLPAGKPAADQT